jgi:hypothetical protein
MTLTPQIHVGGGGRNSVPPPRVKSTGFHLLFSGIAGTSTLDLDLAKSTCMSRRMTATAMIQ